MNSTEPDCHMPTTPTYDPAAFRSVFEQNFTYEAGFRRNTHRYAAATALIDAESGRVGHTRNWAGTSSGSRPGSPRPASARVSWWRTSS
jgi:hypothetical protein